MNQDLTWVMTNGLFKRHIIIIMSTKVYHNISLQLISFELQGQLYRELELGTPH